MNQRRQTATGRNFLKAAAIGIMVLLAPSIRLETDKSSQSRVVSFQSAVSNLNDRIQYLDGLVRHYPVLQSAYNSGVLGGLFLYPEESNKLVAVYRNMAHRAGVNFEESIDEFVNQQLRQHETNVLRGDLMGVNVTRSFVVDVSALGITSRSVYNIFGSAIPHPIVVYPPAWSGTHIHSEIEFLTTIEHELTHIEDNYRGITFPSGLAVASQDIYEKRLNREFLDALIEVRAYYRQLSYILENGVNVNADYWNLLLNNYAVYYTKLRIIADFAGGKASVDSSLSLLQRTDLVKSSEDALAILEDRYLTGIASAQIDMVSELPAKLEPHPSLTFKGRELTLR
ncbi:hypothetical protein HYV82_01415 [Candidatus Woesearchaeota archaeon]|nr:hypothetical protein [Candidatus Woesearchaeota archaeon]